jgi:two-component system CheB/CheR fusion protein
MAIVLLDRQGKIRRFTPMAESVLNLISGDIGRPFSQIKPHIDCPELDRLITDVLNGETMPPLKVRDTQGRWFSLAIRPYQDIHHRIDGVVMALHRDEPTWQE